MRRPVLLFLLVAFLFPALASAIHMESNTVVIPVIGRFPGAFGSEWRTDVFIANPYSPVANVTATFYVTGGPTLTSSLVLQGYNAASLPDIVQDTFGLANAGGQLVLTSDIAIEARARIYNTGSPAGQFGQNVPGLGIGSLSRQAFAYGLSTANGNRVNIGVANPNAVDASVLLNIRDKNSGQLHSEVLTVPAHQTLQFNDIAARYGIPQQGGLQVEFMGSDSSIPLFGYASEVRNDSGDAIFVFGTGPNS